MASIEDLYSSIANDSAAQSGTQAGLALRAGDLASAAPTVPPDCSNAQLQEFFHAHPERDTVAVVADGAPLGLVNRNHFMEQYGKPFSRELFGKASCLSFADAAPLITPFETPIEVLVRHAVAPNSRVMKDGFICTRDGQYCGTGSGMTLLKAMSDIEAEKTRQLLSSIDYASAIQQSNMRASMSELQQGLPDSRLVWLPRDVVGGDCYFFRATRDGMFGAIIDCTGHGVPGAFMTLIALSFLESRIAGGDEAPGPARILGELNRHIKKVLGQDATAKDGIQAAMKSDDGLDAFMFVLSRDRRTLSYAGARLEMAIAVPGEDEVRLLEGDKMGVGYSDTPDDFAYTTSTVVLPPDSRVLVTTDGIIDQIGGPKNIAHGRKRLYRLLAQRRTLAPADLAAVLLEQFAEWQGEQRRRDDVCFLTFAAGA
ncbi:MAG TPA: SpoIIE family protein phosphatase [Noviherbaspirillum sp.]|nr:SpoIIE family protein phosphatase [Noviherbaspirillum sp.]